MNLFHTVLRRHELCDQMKLLLIPLKGLRTPLHHIVNALSADTFLVRDLSEGQIIEHEILINSSLMFVQQLSVKIIQIRLFNLLFHLKSHNHAVSGISHSLPP